MISPISTVSKDSPKTVKTDIFYINDVHGQIPKMERLASASNAFDEFVKNKGSDTFKVSAGDIMLGEHTPTNKVAINFLDIAGISLATLGNHELDKGFKAFKDFIKNSKTIFLGTNMNFPNGKDDKIVISAIREINGNKYGFLGVQPSSLSTRIKDKERLNGVTIDEKPQTIKEIQEGIDNLRKQGINKIILLSHSGIDMDKKIAQEVEGLDVIIGGHSHDLILDAKEGENLFYSKTGEPIVITQAGRDGNNFGVLSLEFDDKGVIKIVQNNVFDTMEYPKNLLMSTIIDKEFGKPQVIGTVDVAPPMPKNPLIEENPYADFLTDAARKELDVDIALINSANLRGALNVGNITDRDISSITPFKNRMVKTYLTEKDLVLAIKHGTASILKNDKKPGLIVGSGITYTFNKKGELLSLNYIDKKGNIQPIDVNNPREDKKYLCTYDDFLAKGGDKFETLNKIDNLIEYYDFDKDTLAINYVKKLGKPLSIVPDGRVKMVD